MTATGFPITVGAGGANALPGSPGSVSTFSTGNDKIVATGGVITTSGDDKIHTFTGPGTFCVSQAAACASNNVVSYVVVAGGGGGGGNDGGGGGGAGGFREDKSPVTPYTASPLDGAGGGGGGGMRFFSTAPGNNHPIKIQVQVLIQKLQ